MGRGNTTRVAAAAVTLALTTAALGGAMAQAQDDELSGELRAWFLAYDEGVEPWLAEIEAEFEAMHPNLDVTLEAPNLLNYRDNITTQVQGGSPPDVAQIATSWMPPLADAGALVDWESVMDPAVLDTLDPTLRDGARYQGALTGIPYLASSRAIFYNVPAWEAAGITEPPETWDELIEQARAMKEAGVEIPFYYEGMGNEAMAAWFPYVYFAFGGDYERDGELVLDMDACVQGLTVWDTMNKEGLLQSDVTAGTLEQQRAAMTSGRAGMTASGPWVVSFYAADESDVEFGTFQIPAGTTQATVGVTDVYATFTDSQNPDAAVAFVEFLMANERNLGFVEDRGMLPVIGDHFGLDTFQAGPLKPFVDALPSAKFVPLHADWVAFDKLGTDAITAMFLDGTGPEVACQAIADGLAAL